MSVGAKAGIGAGVGVAVILAVSAGFFVLSRSRGRGNSRRGAHKLPDRYPGSGRESANEQEAPGFVEKNNVELEMTARRYEDMVPRQSPRQMV